MFNKKKFLLKLMQEDKSLKDVANHLGISIVTLYRKINGTSDFFRNEVYELIKFLNIENPDEIFFNNKVT